MTEGQIMEAVHRTFHRLEVRWIPPLPDTSVWFGYDPLPAAEFFPGIVAATEAAGNTGTFMDVGCGIGTKLSLMDCLGWSVVGIDRCQAYIDAAAELVPDAKLVHADLFDIDRFDADIVYCYRPAVSDRDQHTVETHLVSHMPTGRILFLPAREPSSSLPLEPVAPWVWRRI